MMLEWLNSLDPQELGVRVAELPLHDLPELLRACNLSNQPKEITLKVLESLKTSTQLEEAGKGLEVGQLAALLEDASSLKEKLPSLFVGLSPEVFAKFLLVIDEQQLKTLKQQSILEPLQHQLLLLAQGLSRELAQIDHSVDQFEKKLEDLEVKELNWQGMVQLLTDIANQGVAIDSIQNRASRALSVAWNSGRSDLIELLSKTREQAQRYRLMIIGMPASGAKDSTGLYARLKAKLYAVYDPQLDDSAPATEALVAFSVWYLKDYAEVGLIPPLLDESQLDRAQKEELFNLAKSNLEKYGLKTLGDLKRASIFSKYCLKEYLSQQKE